MSIWRLPQGSNTPILASEALTMRKYQEIIFNFPVSVNGTEVIELSLENETVVGVQGTFLMII